nr:hypothetical protein CFP56_61555 [Quercus suber]
MLANHVTTKDDTIHTPLEETNLDIEVEGEREGINSRTISNSNEHDILGKEYVKEAFLSQKKSTLIISLALNLDLWSNEAVFLSKISKIDQDIQNPYSS